MNLREFREPLAGADLRWGAPLLATALGGLVGPGAFLLIQARGGSSALWCAALIGSAALITGVFGLVFRIRARFAADTWREDELDHRADVAVAASLLVLALTFIVTGAAMAIQASQPAAAYHGEVADMEFDHRRRGGRDVRLVLDNGETFRWSCWLDCAAYREMRSLQEGDWPAQVRVTAVGSSMIGLSTDRRAVLHPGPERRRLQGVAAGVGAAGLLIMAGVGLRMRRLLRQGPGGALTASAWRG